MKYFLRTVYFYTLAFCLLKIIFYKSISWGFIWIPYAVLITTFIVYLLIVGGLVSYSINKTIKTEAEAEFLNEISFFCSGCAKPFNNPVQHRKGERVYHKNCKPKN